MCCTGIDWKMNTSLLVCASTLPDRAKGGLRGACCGGEDRRAQQMVIHCIAFYTLLAQRRHSRRLNHEECAQRTMNNIGRKFTRNQFRPQCHKLLGAMQHNASSQHQPKSYSLQVSDSFRNMSNHPLLHLVLVRQISKKLFQVARKIICGASEIK